MNSRGVRLRQMELEVANIRKAEKRAGRNHAHYLSEASQYLRGVEDPLDVLRFVESLRTSAFTARQEQQRALADVASWLATRLLRDPNLDRGELAWELGWMRRLVTIRDAWRVGETSLRASAARRANGGAPLFDIAGVIAEIERRRLPVPKPRTKHRVVPPLRVVPDKLPAVVEVKFSDIEEVRDARRAAKKRTSKNKPEKSPAWVRLSPIDNALNALAQNLGCWLNAEGLEAVFESFQNNHGHEHAFWATDIQNDGERKVTMKLLAQRNR